MLIDNLPVILELEIQLVLQGNVLISQLCQGLFELLLRFG